MGIAQSICKTNAKLAIMQRTLYSLPPGGRGTTKWWKEPAELSVPPNFIVTHSPSVAFGASSLPEGAFLRPFF